MNRLFILILFNLYSFSAWSQDVDSLRLEQTIDSLRNLGIQYRKDKRLEEAVRIAQTGASLIWERYGENHPQYTGFLHAEGISYSMMGDNEAALQLLLRAREARERAFGKENQYYLNHLHSLAITCKQLGRAEETESYLREFISIHEKMSGKESKGYLSGMEMLAENLLSQRRFMEAETALFTLEELYRKVYGPDHLSVGRMQFWKGVMWRETGKLEQAVEYLQRAISIIEKNKEQDPGLYCNILNYNGIVHAETFQFDLAEQYYRKALNAYETTYGKNRGYAVTLDNLGNLYGALGIYEQALLVKKEAIEILQGTVPPNSPDNIRLVCNLALAYGSNDQFKEAFALFQEAEILNEKSFPADIQNTCFIPSNQAWVNYLKGDFSKSIAYFSKSLELIRAHYGADHFYFIKNSCSLAQSLLAAGDPLKAEAILQEVQPRVQTIIGTDNIEYVNYLTTYIDLLFATNRREELPSILNEYSRLIKKLIRQGAQHLSENELAGMYSDFQNYSNKIFSYAWLEETPQRTELERTCFDQTLYDKGFLLNSAIQLRNLSFEDSTSQQLYLNLLQAKRYLSAQYARPLEERIGVEELENRVTMLEKDLARRAPNYVNALREINWQELQKVLPEGGAAVEWVHFQYQTVRKTDSIFYGALVLCPGWEAPRFIPLFEEKQLDSLLQTQGERRADYVNHLYSLADRGLIPSEKPRKSLYELVWQPLEPALAGIHTVFFASSGLLHRLNLGAIPVSDMETLADRYLLVQLGSTRQLVFPPSIRSSTDDIALFGGIVYEIDTAATSGQLSEPVAARTRGWVSFAHSDSRLRTGNTWDYLPGSEREIRMVNDIARLTGMDTKVFSGQNATEEVFKQLAGTSNPSPRVLHLATHGFFFPDPEEVRKEAGTRPLIEPEFKISDHPMIRSGLILAGANHAWKTGKPLKEDMEDGILTAYEISQLNLSNTELVVLSACETGLGDIRGHEGVYGLQRAFKIAGAKYLIMSLWQVPDKQTSLLMTSFYRKWLEERMTIPEALHSAQQELRDLGFDPYYWAGFVLVE